MKRYFSFYNLKDFLSVAIGCMIYGISSNIFIIPNHIAPGGATGLSVIANYLFHVPVGTMIIVFNIPLFILSQKMLGKTFLFRTITATILLSVFVDLFVFLPHYTGDRLVAGLFGGAFGGIGLGIVFSRGVMTGGSDLLARIIKRKAHNITLGQLILIIDAFVITLAAFAFKDITAALYAVISIFVSTKAIDSVLSGFDTAKTAIIVTSKKDEISKGIISGLGRTATILDAVGAYSNDKRSMLFCVVRRHEFYKLKKMVNLLDDKAFVMVMDTSEVLGLGFKEEYED